MTISCYNYLLDRISKKYDLDKVIMSNIKKYIVCEKCVKLASIFISCDNCGPMCFNHYVCSNCELCYDCFKIMNYYCASCFIYYGLIQ